MIERHGNLAYDRALENKDAMNNQGYPSAAGKWQQIAAEIKARQITIHRTDSNSRLHPSNIQVALTDAIAQPK